MPSILPCRCVCLEKRMPLLFCNRLCIRLLPVQRVCHASLEEIGAAAKALTGPHFPGGEGAAAVRFAVQYEHRASVELKRMDVINAVVDQIPQVWRSAPEHVQNRLLPSGTAPCPAKQSMSASRECVSPPLVPGSTFSGHGLGGGA